MATRSVAVTGSPGVPVYKTRILSLIGELVEPLKRPWAAGIPDENDRTCRQELIIRTAD